MIKLILILFSYLAFPNNGLEVVSSNERELLLSYKPELVSLEEIPTSNNFITYSPKIRGAIANVGEPGTPQSFYYPVIINVPSKDTYKVSLISSIEFNELDQMMTPIASLNINSDEQVYKIHSEYFDENFNFELKDEFLGSAAGQNVLRLKIPAAGFNNRTGKILIPNRILIKVEFYPELAPKTIIKNRNFNSAINSNISFSNQSFASEKTKKNFELQNDRIISSGNWLKIKITEEGIYKISKSDIESKGLKISKEELETIKLIGYGGRPISEDIFDEIYKKMPENDFILNKNSSGELDNIIFYANGPVGFKQNGKGVNNYVNWYSNSNYYLLTWGGDKTITSEPENYQGEIANRPEWYYANTFFYEDLINPYSMGSGREMFGKNFTEQEFTTELDNLVRNQQIRYRFGLGHNNSDSDAFFSIWENGKVLTEKFQLYGISLTSYVAADRPIRDYFLNSNEIADNNNSKIRIKYTSSGYSSGIMDFFEIHYPRTFTAKNNKIGFYTDIAWVGGNEITINGFNNDLKYGFDVTDPSSPKIALNHSSSPNQFVLRFNQDKDILKRFYISSDIKNVPSLEKVTIKNLRQSKDNSDLVIITHKDLLESAGRYKALKESTDNLKVSIFTTEDIFNEFAAGVPDITAIRDFLAYIYYNWEKAPSYALFWGDAHTDYRNIVNKNINYVPVYLSPDSTRQFNELFSTQFDDYYVRIDGNDKLIDMAIGRIPLYDDNNMTANERGDWFTEKTRIYLKESDPGTWRSRVTLVADDGLQSASSNANDGNLHTNASEELSRLSSMQQFILDKIYLIEYSTDLTKDGRRKKDVNKDIISSVNDEGALLLNYTGHGNPKVWAHEWVLTQSESIPLLDNLGKQFFVCAATCEFGRFDGGNGSIAAEEMLFSENGGAIGVFAATRLVLATDNANINELFFDKLLKKDTTTKRYNRIGDVLFQVKQSLNGSNDEKYLILGDPTLRLNLPEYTVAIDSFPNTQIEIDSENKILLKALSKINIAGHIKDENGNFDPTFNGQVLISLFDGDKQIEIIEDNRNYRFSKYGGILNKALVPVKNGVFTFETVLPKDISYSASSGRIYAFANNEENTIFANGFFNNFKVFGVDGVSITDNDKPDIQIYLDSRKFQPGDMVSKEPLLIVDLSDNIGINSTGVGIGHKIEAWVNDNLNSIDLSENYKAGENDNKSASTSGILRNLNPGLNKVRVRAWDLFNNFTISETYFYIAENDSKIYVDEISNYPNPFYDRTTISFVHNLNPGYEYEVKIYTLNGDLIKTIEGIKNTNSDRQVAEIEWDGTDFTGRKVLTGSYLIQVNVTSAEGFSKNNSGVISIKLEN